MGKRKAKTIVALLMVFAFICSSVAASNGNAVAAGKKNIKSVTVKSGGKKVTKKTVTLQKEQKTTLKVSVSPRKAKKHVTYTSSKKSVAIVSKKGVITAKKAGTAKIEIAVSAKGYKKKTTWVRVKVVNSKDTASDGSNPNTSESSTSVPAPNTPESNTPTSDVQPPVTGNGKSLVVYFSRTGTTKAVAEEIQSLTGSDLVELKTVVSYPSSYNDCLAQAQEERANNARPKLSTVVSNMSEYDTVYVGASDIIRTS